MSSLIRLSIGAMNRKQRRASKRSSAMSASGAAAGTATFAELFGAAVTRHQAGALVEAEHRYRHILALFPGHPETYSRLGAVLMAQGKANDAIAHLERALALKADLFEASGNLAQAYLWTGRGERAVEAARRMLELKETEQSKALFAHCIRFVQFTSDDERFRKLALRALSEAWARPRELANACISLIKLDRVVNDCMSRANSAWPARLSATELFGASGAAALSRNELLGRLLECDPVTDLALERLLTNVRYAMLTSAHDGCDADLLGFYCSVARQCFINEYVFSMSDAEADVARRLRASLEASLVAGTSCPAAWPAIVGAYFPLHAVANADILHKRPWQQCVEALIVQQIKEPAEERRIAAATPVLTSVDGAVSRAVRQQYEQSPYPRWVTSGQPGQSAIAADGQPKQAIDVLIAGCGTGLSTIEFARQVPQARVLAIDLSLASLAYAKRMAQNLGLTSIEFAQADIMNLGSITRQFDFIDASGVLHHLADPWAGWQILLSLLRLGGTMQVGLYSERARRNVVEARALIAQRGYRPTADDIRRCRDEIAAAEDGSLLKSLTRLGDFFTTSECRDLLFHPQEHRLTLPDIKAFLAANNLQFAGFALPAAVLHAFAKRFPGQSMTDLDRWHAFESEAPETFSGMYLFSVHKAAAARV
jgi:SAM-dependent methyltransferase